MGVGTGVGAAAGLVVHSGSSVIVGLVAGIVVGSGLYAWEQLRYKRRISES